MEINQLNMYQRLRDFHVPVTILDEIFASGKMIKILLESWELLQKSGMQEDKIAETIAQLVFKELDIDPDDYKEK